ncbi:MAG: hypothetical protein PHV30_06450 [Candidatus Margulisbacteria bacterium]|nr:hypothetical protein [Candidatus Margulisiibacteriota bacterium]
MNYKLIAQNHKKENSFQKADKFFLYFQTNSLFFLNASVNLITYNLKNTMAKLMIRTEYASLIEGNRYLLDNLPEKNAEILAAKIDTFFNKTQEAYFLYETEIFDLLNYKLFNTKDIAALLMLLIRMKSPAGIALFEFSTASLKLTHNDIDRNEIYALWEQLDSIIVRLETEKT